MPPRPVIAFALAFVLGAAAAQEKQLTWTMLMLWAAVAIALGYRLPLRTALTTGAIFGGSLGFSSVFYAASGPLPLFGHFDAIAAGTAIGAVCGMVAAGIGAVVSGAIFAPAKAPDSNR